MGVGVFVAGTGVAVGSGLNTAVNDVLSLTANVYVLEYAIVLPYASSQHSKT